MVPTPSRVVQCAAGITVCPNVGLSSFRRRPGPRQLFPHFANQSLHHKLSRDLLLCQLRLNATEVADASSVTAGSNSSDMQDVRLVDLEDLVLTALHNLGYANDEAAVVAEVRTELPQESANPACRPSSGYGLVAQAISR